ncbi:MAG: type II secretion system protein [Chlamydiales bacterium]|nr:type II secretion system protein [Chlamydiales bacterium]
MSRRSFTLIEILLVVALIGLTLGVVSIQFPKVLSGETFERGVDQVKSRIALAQELMLNYQTDILLEFEYDHKEKGMRCFIHTGKPLSENLKKNVNLNCVIAGIEEVEFGARGANNVVLHFDGTLGATPKGVLILKGKNREALLTLRGFPSQILRGEHVVENTEAVYPEEALSFI